MRKALVVGINYYEEISSLYGCVADAIAVKDSLETNYDGTVNFSAKLLTAMDARSRITRSTLRENIRELFTGDSEIALLFFAGHGHIETTGGYLCASDTSSGDDGLSLSDVMTFANKSKARNRIIILDSCFSGIAGGSPIVPQSSELLEGTTILTASTAEQYASEQNGSGVFTNLFVDALHGSAADLLGAITPGSVYAHIDQALGPWEQRPVFKTNVKSFVSLRSAKPSVSPADLRQLAHLFKGPGFEYQLDPSYEPTDASANPANTTVFELLQRLNRVNVVIPVGEQHMYYAAMNRKACRLTALGEHYRRLVVNKRL